MKQAKKPTKQNYEFKGTRKKVANQLLKSVINSFFSQGYLTKDDLNLSEADFFKKVENIYDKSDLSIGIDHREDIIGKADILHRKKDYNYAKVLYAMFFEHSINYLINHECQKRKIDEKTKIEIIRSIDIYGKLTWMPKLLGFPKFNDTHRITIKKLSDDRNAFVHYKWNAVKDEEEDKNSTQKTEDEFKKIKLAIKYMKQYSTNILYQKSKKQLNKKIAK